MNQIAQRAGVGPATLHRDYPSRTGENGSVRARLG
jgi:AcrR family transcriptional regulator